MPVIKACSWSVHSRASRGQASVEAMLVALSLLAIVLLPVTTTNETLVELLDRVVQSWMFVFAVTWQYFLLHPWVA